MFFLRKLRRDILLEPCNLGRNMKERVAARVKDELEGMCLGKLGYIILILKINEEDIKPGLIDIDTGKNYALNNIPVKKIYSLT